MCKIERSGCNIVVCISYDMTIATFINPLVEMKHQVLFQIVDESNSIVQFHLLKNRTIFLGAFRQIMFF